MQACNKRVKQTHLLCRWSNSHSTSKSGNQSERQPVGWWAHTDTWELHPLLRWCRGNVSWLWSSKAEIYSGGAPTEDMHQATLNLFIIFLPRLYICPPSLHLLPPLREKIQIQAFEKLQIIWNTFWTFILKWGAAAASAASVRFGAKLIIPHKRALLSVLTQGWDAG